MAEKPRKRQPPATTSERRENQMIALAMDLAEEQLRNGTATSQVVTHYLKLATTREQLEKEKLRQENEHLKAKTLSMASNQNVEQLYSEAIKAFRGYSGQEDPYLDGYDD